jgi:signal transduction histidine kinase
MKIIYLKTIHLIAFICYSTLLYSQDRFTITNYTTDNGLPQNTVRDFLFDNAGYLWVATENGLVRYDGSFFRLFSSPGVNTLNNRIQGLTTNIEKRSFAIDVNNRLEEIRNGKLYLIEKGKQGEIADMDHLLGTQLPYKLFSRFNKTNFLNNNSMPTGQMIAISPSSFILIYPNDVHLYKDTLLAQKFSFPTAETYQVFRIGTNVIIFNQQKGFYQLDLPENNWKPLHNKSGLKDLLPSQIAWKSNQLFPYLVYNKKIYRLEQRNNEIHAVLTIDSITNTSRVNKVEYNKNWDLYVVGTESEGLFIYRKIYFEEHTINNENRPYYGQLPISKDAILTNNGDIISSENNKSYKSPIKKFYNYIIQDQQNIYFPVGDTVYRYNQKSGETQSIFISKGAQIYALEYHRDTLWMINANGIFYHTRDGNHVSLVFPPNMNNLTYAIQRISDDKFLYGNCLGLFSYQTSTKNVDTLLWMPQKCVRTLWKYDNKIFIGTYGDGWKVWDGKKIINMPIDRNQYLLYTHCFVKDSSNYLWVPTNRGLFKYYMPDIDNYLAGKTQALYYYHYGKADGIRNTEFNGGCFPCYVRMSNGLISLPNLGGLVWYRAENTSHTIPYTGVYVDKLEVNNQVIEVDDNTISLPSKIQVFRIELSSPYFGEDLNNLVEYRTFGIDTAWKPLNPLSPVIRYSTLPAGNYKIEIRKPLGFGKPYYLKTINFSVATAWYRKPLAVAAWIIAATALLMLIFRWRVASYKKRQVILKMLVDKKVEELKLANNKLEENLQKLETYQLELVKRDLNKSRYISIISHDLIGPLRFIDMVASQVKKYGKSTNPETVIDSVEEIGTTSKNLLNLCNDIINWINLESGKVNLNSDYFDLYQLISEKVSLVKKLASGKRIDFPIKCESPFYIRNDRNVIGIILQNLLTNALKFTSKGYIETGTDINGSHFYLYVRDTGKGMPASRIDEIVNSEPLSLLGGKVSTSGYGLGFVIIKDMLQLTKGKLTIQSSDDGTLVRIEWPQLTNEQSTATEKRLEIL